MDTVENSNKVIVAIDGNRDDSKKFVRLSRQLGYDTEKVNPLALDIRMATNVVPKSHAEYPFIERAIHEFREERNLHYWFMASRIENSNASLVLLVNVPKNSLPQVQSDFSVFSLYVGDGEGYSDKRHDWYIKNINKESVERFLRIVSK